MTIVKSLLAASSIANPFAPSFASSTRQPRRAKKRRSADRIDGSSSMISTRGEDPLSIGGPRPIVADLGVIFPGASASAPSTGSETVNRAPPPSSDPRFSTEILPPSCSTTPSVTDRPRPVPSPTGFVVKNGSKIRLMSDAGMPGPESSTTMVSSRPTTVARRRTSATLTRCLRSVDHEVRHDLLKAGGIGIPEYRARQAAPR